MILFACRSACWQILLHCAPTVDKTMPRAAVSGDAPSWRPPSAADELKATRRATKPGTSARSSRTARTLLRQRHSLTRSSRTTAPGPSKKSLSESETPGPGSRKPLHWDTQPQASLVLAIDIVGRWTTCNRPSLRRTPWASEPPHWLVQLRHVDVLVRSAYTDDARGGLTCDEQFAPRRVVHEASEDVITAPEAQPTLLRRGGIQRRRVGPSRPASRPRGCPARGRTESHWTTTVSTTGKLRVTSRSAEGRAQPLMRDLLGQVGTDSLDRHHDRGHEPTNSSPRHP